MKLCAIHSQWYVQACPMCAKNNSYEVPFDSYYEHGFETGVQAERERIIKLLQEERDAANEQTVIRNVLNGAIALIKGENK